MTFAFFSLSLFTITENRYLIWFFFFRKKLTIQFKLSNFVFFFHSFISKSLFICPLFIYIWRENQLQLQFALTLQSLNKKLKFVSKNNHVFISSILKYQRWKFLYFFFFILQKYDRYKYIRKHIRACHCKVTFSCKLCKKSFKSQYKLKSHMLR